MTQNPEKCSTSTGAAATATAHNAYHFGYNVVLVADSISDRDTEAHRWTVEKIFPRLGETETTANVLKLLVEWRASLRTLEECNTKRWATPVC